MFEAREVATLFQHGGSKFTPLRKARITARRTKATAIWLLGNAAIHVAGAGDVVRADDSPSNAGRRPNVLFIAIDDQNDWIGCLGGHPQVRTPNLDRLAARGTLFTNAHCQAPLCNPSRASLLTGLRPSTTGVHGLAPGIRDVESLKKHVTLPETFTQAG